MAIGVVNWEEATEEKYEKFSPEISHGSMVGLEVVLAVGLAVGYCVGDIVGESVGSFVRTGVGPGVGARVGRGVGGRLGRLVGGLVLFPFLNDTIVLPSEDRYAEKGQ